MLGDVHRGRDPGKIAIWVALFSLLFSCCSAAAGAAAVTLPADFNDEFVANASEPTALAFVPGGRLLITEKAGVVRIYENGAVNATPALDIARRSAPTAGAA